MIGRKNRRGPASGSSNYPESFRNQVARDYENGDLSYAQIAEKYSLASKELPKWWVRCYRKKSEIGITSLSPMTEKEKREQKALEKRIAALEKQLADAELRALAYDTLIDVAEEELKINIRKKPGTKQSND